VVKRWSDIPSCWFRVSTATEPVQCAEYVVRGAGAWSNGGKAVVKHTKPWFRVSTAELVSCGEMWYEVLVRGAVC
jgi:hypothetical protein